VSGGSPGVATPPHDVVAFWQAAGRDKWFTKDAVLDAAIRERFLGLYKAATDGGLTSWEATSEGALALLILLDQFPRNMFRGSARIFAADPLARAVAERALAMGYEGAVTPDMRLFFYLPFMHSEALADQEHSVALFRALGDEECLRYAEDHADIVRRFGRFPHRNDVLGRETTAEEQAFLAAGGFSG